MAKIKTVTPKSNNGTINKRRMIYVSIFHLKSFNLPSELDIEYSIHSAKQNRWKVRGPLQVPAHKRHSENKPIRTT